MTAQRIVGLLVTSASMLGCLTFALSYWRWFPWWKSAAGRNLFAFVAVDGLINATFIVSIIAQPGWIGWIRWVLLGVYAFQPVVIWWRVSLLVHVHRTPPD